MANLFITANGYGFAERVERNEVGICAQVVCATAAAPMRNVVNALVARHQANGNAVRAYSGVAWGF